MTTKTKEEPATAIAAAPKKKGTGSRRKAGQKAKPAENETKNEEIAASDKPSEVPAETPAPAMAEGVQEEVKAPAAKGRKGKATSRTKKSAEQPKEEPSEPKQAEAKPEERDTPVQQRPAKPREISANIEVEDFCDLVNQGARIPLLSDQQIQQLTLEEASMRCEILERILCKVLNYDIVLSDTNIWLELQVGHSSSHSDPKVNARLQFERQLESLSKMMKRIGGRFMIMSETYEEVDRFASVLDPVSYKDADWTDEVLCRNVAARLAKRLMLAQQKENRLRIEGIGSESHHSAFADPAIIRRTVELFAQGKKVLLLTNDASVGIRSLGMCDDLQRYNSIDDATWRSVYEPLGQLLHQARRYHDERRSHAEHEHKGHDAHHYPACPAQFVAYYLRQRRTIPAYAYHARHIVVNGAAKHASEHNPNIGGRSEQNALNGTENWPCACYV